MDANGLVLIEGASNGYRPDNADIAANILEAMSVKDLPLCQKLQWFYKKVNYGAQWDFKNQNDSDFPRQPGENYTPEFENFGNWHYGVVGAAAGIQPWMLTNAAGLVQIKNGTAKLEYIIPNGLLNCDGECQPLVYPLSLKNYDDPNDQYWINKGIRDYFGNNATSLRGADYAKGR